MFSEIRAKNRMKKRKNKLEKCWLTWALTTHKQCVYATFVYTQLECLKILCIFKWKRNDKRNTKNQQQHFHTIYTLTFKVNRQKRIAFHSNLFQSTYRFVQIIDIFIVSVHMLKKKHTHTSNMIDRQENATRKTYAYI